MSGCESNEREHRDGELTDWSMSERNCPGGNSISSLKAGG